MKENKIPLIVILGPTAVGKTALGIQLAQQFNGEIISADSRQFYRHMDIGTAKPTPAEQAAARHHLIDIADPDETVGLAQFLTLARDCIKAVHASGHMPMLVGGTGQYIKALLQGWQVPNIPPDHELRAQLEAQAAREPDALWAQLTSLDPDVEAFIDRRNIRRVIRALEVCLKSGKPYSELRTHIPPPYRVLQIGLTADRQFLYDRADARVDRMMAQGLCAEVENLLQLGYGWSLPAMSGLGYSQFRPYFEEEVPLGHVVERIKLDTHDFIRRQYTWFRAIDPAPHWLDIQDAAFKQQALNFAASFVYIAR